MHKNLYGFLEPSLESVQLGIVVNLETLRAAFKDLNVISGRAWGIAGDPAEAYESGYLTIGHGHPACTDRLNALYYRIPVVSQHEPQLKAAYCSFSARPAWPQKVRASIGQTTVTSRWNW